MTLTPDVLQLLVRAVFNVRQDEITCDECFARVDRFAEMRLGGLDAAAALPLVEDHLQRCHECRDEFSSLMDALRAAAGDLEEATERG